MEKDNKVVLRSMVVDDNQVNTMILAKMLDLFNINVDQANNGKIALIMSENTNYDIIFIDHIMPEMDGVQVTEAIRNNATNQHKTIVIALTSDNTENTMNLFLAAGANDVYSKPLGLMELFNLLNKWFPEASINIIATDESTTSYKEEQYIQKIIEEVEDIDYFIGLRSALGKPIHYINILKVSFNDIQLCINSINKSIIENSIKDLRISIHNLICILSNVGAVDLLEEARFVETIALQNDIYSLRSQCTIFLNHLEQFKEKLRTSLEKYSKSIQLESNGQNLVYIPMSKEEYEQSLLNTIYYIKRFEYDSIIKNLEELIHRGQTDFKQEFEEALVEIKDFNYDNALIRMMKLKNEIGK